MTNNDRTEIEKRQAAVPTGLKPLGLYIHIPFCRKKCAYCDFVSFAGKEAWIDPYVDRLCEEIADRGAEYGNLYYVDSIFTGGGTPSLLSSAQLEKIVLAVNKAFLCGCSGTVSPGAVPGTPGGPEFTVECNPGTVDAEKFRAMKEMGVTRVSMGVQSFSNPVLRKLGRIHDAGTALYAMDLAAAAGLDYNIDLMFGVPGQSLNIWKKTLKTAVEKRPSHISFYSLQLEEDTPLYLGYQAGTVDLPSWEENREMYHFAVKYLKESGYCHYELSNAALPGKECRHNLKYWTMGDYLGVGAAAYSFMGQRRFYNTSDLERYLYAPGFGCYQEDPDETGLKGDWVFTALRLTGGFSLKGYEEYFGASFGADFGKAADSLIADGLLEYYPDGLRSADGSPGQNYWVRMTEKGMDCTNPVMERLLAQLENKQKL